MGNRGQELTLSGEPDGHGLEVGAVATEDQLRAYAESAESDGRRLVVGAIVTDGDGNVFVQRRRPDRDLFPGAWDMVGGHAEEGEDAVTALRREVEEETGWRLRELGPVVELIDWEAGGVPRREIDLLVTVDGDLNAPRIEVEKHDEWRWLSREDTSVLDEGRGAEDVWLRGVIERALDVLDETGFGR